MKLYKSTKCLLKEYRNIFKKIFVVDCSKPRRSSPEVEAIRDFGPDQANPWTIKAIANMFDIVPVNKDAVNIAISEIESVQVGRGSGYGAAEFYPQVFMDLFYIAAIGNYDPQGVIIGS